MFWRVICFSTMILVNFKRFQQNCKCMQIILQLVNPFLHIISIFLQSINHKKWRWWPTKWGSLQMISLFTFRHMAPKHLHYKRFLEVCWLPIVAEWLLQVIVESSAFVSHDRSLGGFVSCTIFCSCVHVEFQNCIL